MSVLDDLTVQARRNGVSCVTIAEKLAACDGGASVEDVVHAYAVAGYPPSDTIDGVSKYMMILGRESGENFQKMLDKMKEVGYPEVEIQAALDEAKG